MLKKLLVASIIMIITIVAFTAYQLFFVYKGNVVAYKNLVNFYKEPIDLNDYELIALDGTQQKISDTNGKNRLVMFWATWCKYCLSDMPEIIKFASDNKSANLAVLALAVPDDPIAKARNIMQTKNNQNMKVYLNSSGAIYKSLRLKGVPSYIIIDKNGFGIASLHPTFDEDLAKLLVGVR